jgi:hypothetical protein
MEGESYNGCGMRWVERIAYSTAEGCGFLWGLIF